MNVSKHNILWDLLSKYNFDVELKYYQDLICIICKKLLINAYQSCCGCRYCFDCIENYLQNDTKLCPGKMDECKEIMININDVQVDHVANAKVSKVCVKCPEDFCQFTDELRKIENHIKSHKIKCPYFDIGCNKSGLNCSNVGNHMNCEHGSHAALLIDTIQNMRNEISCLRENLSRKDSLFINLENQLKETKLENYNCNNAIESLNRDVSQYKQLINKLSSEVCTLTADIKTIKKANQRKEAQINTLNQKVLKLSTSPPQLKEDKVENKKKTSIDGASNINTKTNPETLLSLNPFKLPLTSIEKNFSEFTWKIVNFSEKRNSAKNFVNSFILSDSFYSHENGYKMCLTVFPDGCNKSKNAWLCVGFHIMQGENDCYLRWPMTMYVTIGLVDQKAGEIRLGETYHYDSTLDINKDRFSQPKFGMNKARGTVKFTSLNGLVNNKKLCKDDTIIIKCVVESSLSSQFVNNKPQLNQDEL